MVKLTWIRKVRIYRNGDGKPEQLVQIKGGKKGIVTIIGLVYFIILLIIFGFLFVPLWASILEPQLNASFRGVGLMLGKLIPTIFLLGIVIAWFIYAGSA